MKRFVLTVLVALLATACTGTGGDQPAVDTSRIVSLSGDLTEILFELGVGDRVVGVDVTTVAPEPATSIPIVGVGRFLTAEAVLGVDPTMVLADTQTSPVSALEQIQAAGVLVEKLAVAESFQDLYAKIAQVGEIVDRVGEAEELAIRVEAEVEEAAALASNDHPRIAYVYTRGPDVNLLFGDGMTTRPLIEAAGAVDAGASIGITGTAPVTAEALVDAAPDVIVVPAEGLELLGGIEAFLEIPGVAQTPAGRRGAILTYPEGDFLTFGPRVADSLSLLIADLADLSS